MAQRWCTKEDVLKDLELALGHRVADVDEGYFQYGEQPPRPRAVEDEDDEIEMRFERAASQRQGQGDEPGPDLIGITNLLRIVENYENSSDQEPAPSNKKIIISKANSNILANAEKTHPNLEEKDSRISPNLRVVSGKVNSNNKPSDKMALNDGLSSNEEEESSANNILPNIKPTSSNVTSPTKIITNNVTVISQLNPYVKEFIPRRVLIASSQNDKASEDKTDATKEMKKQMAMMLKSHISVKNETNQSQQQTNKAIVSLLRLYAEPKPDKPLKLLTPQFFEECKASDFNCNIEELNDTDHSLERMTSIHNVKEVNGDVTSYSPRSPIAENKKAASVGIKPSENSDMTADVSLYEERDGEEKNNNALATNYFTENNISTSNEDNNTCYDENNYRDIKIKDHDIYKENENIQAFNEIEATQLKPDIIIEQSNEPSEIGKLDPYMIESISKVNNWLHDKPVVTVTDKSKRPMLCLEPYKLRSLRKDLVSPEASNSRKNISIATEYKPSSYAEELHKKYSAKSKTSTPTPTLDMWEKLKADLKKQDLVVKSRKKSLKGI